MKHFYTTDLRALNHILTKPDIYKKPEAALYNVSQIIGNGKTLSLIATSLWAHVIAGLIVVEGEQHRAQVSFHPQAIYLL